MSKIHLIIADADEAYVDCIVNYIANNYSHRFQVNSFTEQQYLSDYISSNEKDVDILLICNEWYTNPILKDKIGTIIILSEGMLTDEAIDYKVINKYQRGDKLVSSILNCFAEANPNKCYISDKEKKTKLIAVYSPIGGVGKTSITVASSIKSAEDGKSVFYLNLENIQSTSNFFDCENCKSISNVLYYIKEKKKNITMKIEGVRCIDSQYNIHYFSPPDSCIDLNEMSIDEVQYLLDKLKGSKDYDEIFIDMSSNLDEKNVAVLNTSDEIILVVEQGDMAMTKMNLFMAELDMFSKRNCLDLSHKMRIVLNKYKHNTNTQIDEIGLYGKSISVKIPAIYEPISLSENNCKKEIKTELKSAIAEILRMIE